MTKKKTFLAEISLKTVLTELVPAKKAGRPPKKVGQGKNTQHVRLHDVTFKELKKRVDAARVILETGKLPKEKADAPPPEEEDKEKKELQDYLTTNEVPFNKQLGVKKLQALKEKFEDTLTDPA